mmetsp:Transcript_29111/g.38288  ORF Transcript_29111/g.38288 Transcript_29111/m.38288 type:complete len:109 (-) Transcript_29111:99-425(-)
MEEKIGVTPRINGGLRSQFVGKTVLLVGRVLNQNGVNATIQASDGQAVQINRTPGQNYNSTFIEVTGQIQSDLSVQEYKSCEFGDNFNLQNYEALVQLATGKYSNLFY